MKKWAAALFFARFVNSSFAIEPELIPKFQEFSDLSNVIYYLVEKQENDLRRLDRHLGNIRLKCFDRAKRAEIKKMIYEQISLLDSLQIDGPRIEKSFFLRKEDPKKELLEWMRGMEHYFWSTKNEDRFYFLEKYEMADPSNTFFENKKISSYHHHSYPLSTGWEENKSPTMPQTYFKEQKEEFKALKEKLSGENLDIEVLPNGKTLDWIDEKLTGFIKLRILNYEFNKRLSDKACDINREREKLFWTAMRNKKTRRDSEWPQSWFPDLALEQTYKKMAFLTSSLRENIIKTDAKLPLVREVPDSPDICEDILPSEKMRKLNTQYPMIDDNQLWPLIGLAIPLKFRNGVPDFEHRRKFFSIGKGTLSHIFNIKCHEREMLESAITNLKKGEKLSKDFVENLKGSLVHGNMDHFASFKDFEETVSEKFKIGRKALAILRANPAKNKELVRKYLNRYKDVPSEVFEAAFPQINENLNNLLDTFELQLPEEEQMYQHYMGPIRLLHTKNKETIEKILVLSNSGK